MNKGQRKNKICLKFQVFLSHHCPIEIKTVFPENLEQKPDVRSMTENEIIFVDETREDVDVVMYCTGI